MGLIFATPLIQLIGIGVPLVGCVSLFKKEHNKASMSLLLTNIGCLFINCIYMLMLATKSADAAIMAQKIFLDLIGE